METCRQDEFGEVPFASGIEQVLDSVEVEKNASLRLPAKKV